ncbi:MAG TPA: DUF1134 domain-containing protein [Hyphomonadaceae bacterium]|nr:DUF1134 domain-containing protein [Hyphomonadaceae bacterium]
MKLVPILALCAISALGINSTAQARPAAPVTSPAPTPLSATATFKATNIAIGVGYSWGHGVLSYKGRTYPFTVKGLSALGIGASTIDGTAEVYKLKSLADFEGVYGAAGVGATVGPIGAGTGGLTNRKGVELRLNTQSEGLELTLAISGVTIEFDK